MVCESRSVVRPSALTVGKTNSSHAAGKQNCERTMSGPGDDRPSQSPDPLTRFCPVCGYDLRGLPDQRCPECGHAFDPATLPLTRERDVPSSPAATLALAGAILLAFAKFGWGQTQTNTFGQVVWIALMWALAAIWAVLRRNDWSRAGRQYLLLWLLVICAGTPDRPFLPDPVKMGMTIFSATVAATILIYAVTTCPVSSLRVTLTVVSWILLISGVASVAIGIPSYILDDASQSTTNKYFESSYNFFGHEVPATGVNHLYAAAVGGAMILLCMGARYVVSLLRRHEKR